MISSSSSISLTKSETIEDNNEQQQSRSSFDGSPPQLVVDEMNSSNTNEITEDDNDQPQSIDNSPPRLVVDEISTEPGAIPSPDALTASVNTFIGTNNSSTSNDSIEQLTTTICEICSKSFPTKFLHVHMNNVHGIQQPPIILTNGITNNNNNQLVGNTIKRPLTNGSNTNVRLKQTPQVQLRVTCQVCKKVC
jgi:hypothetical protein